MTGNALLMEQHVSRNEFPLSYSVVIPVWNGGAHLGKCLQALAASVRKPDQIVVVDDSSTDHSAAIARASGCDLVTLQDGPWGPATARNCGVSAARGDIILFVDCDVTVHPETLGRIDRQFRSTPELAGVFGSYDDRPSDAGLVSGYRNLLHHHVHQCGRREASTFWAGCGAIRREVFEAARGFDETYRWASIEDIQLGLRLHLAGHQLRLCPEIQATHHKRWSLKQVFHTDVFHRAVPWTKLLLGHGFLPNDLNLRWENRVSALAVWIFLLLLISSIAHPQLWSAVAGLFLLLLGCNRNLYRLFYRRRGSAFLLGSIALHWLHYLYTSATVALVVLETWLRLAASVTRPLQQTAPQPLVARD